MNVGIFRMILFLHILTFISHINHIYHINHITYRLPLVEGR
jgi:hypothetical protein